MKNKRQQTLLSIINEADIETQEELLEELKKHGYDVTQATISRDIKELHLVKVSTGKSSYKYAEKNLEDPRQQIKFLNILRETIISVNHANNLLVIKTYSGMANAAAAAIDTIWKQEILGCIAGDDTIIAVVHTDGEARTLCEDILDYLK